MRLLVLTGLSIPDAYRYLPHWPSYEGEHQININVPAEKPDAILLMSVSKTADTIQACDQWPDAPLFVYHWDCYSWVWTRPRPGEYNYTDYGRLVERAMEVFVPSECTGRQLQLWWGYHNWTPIWPAVHFWDRPTADHGYALCTLRHLPDFCNGWFERACRELNIPYVSSDHGLSRTVYEEAIAQCRFIVSPYMEASTGGLSLIEAYALRKPVLINDSEWNGANQYFGNRAARFFSGSYTNFKEQLSILSTKPSPVLVDQCAWAHQYFSDERMIECILERIDENLV